MITLPAGSFRMGSEDFYPDEGPIRMVSVEAFEIDSHPVTNREFAEFVERSGYVTVAERNLSEDDFPQLHASERAAGSLVFRMTRGPVDLSDWRQWWTWVAGANWRSPSGPGSSTDDKLDHPVVHVAFEDAQAYAWWHGKRLPTEKEWEYAARGGLDGAIYAWGNEPQISTGILANTWQGNFPYSNTGARGWIGTSPVGTFPANAYGLYDMIGNVWEWTTSSYESGAEHCPCAPEVPAPTRPLVLKGGSHLCAPEYCFRYRPAARSPQTPDSATSHIGFRCVR